MHRAIRCCLLLVPGTALAAQPQWIESGKRHLPPGPSTTRAIASGDFDGDGDGDLFLGCAGRDRLLRNEGHGVFADVTGGNLAADARSTGAVVVGDVDGDGDPDVLVGGGVPVLRLYLNDGRGAFTEATVRLPAGLPAVLDLALGDVDGDGDLDVLSVHSSPSIHWVIVANRLLRNDGGLFRDAPDQIPQNALATAAVALGDVDGDRYLDVMLANTPFWTKGGSVSGRERLYRNDGTGRFSDASAQALPPDEDDTLDVALVDVDGDGDLDLLGMNGAANKLYRNDGTGVFADATAGRIPPDPATKTRLVTGDIDGDGDVDFATAHRTWTGSVWAGAQNRLFVNDGSGTYTDATTARLPAIADTTAALAFADVDGDRDLDLVVGNDGQSDGLLLNDGAGSFTDAVRLPALRESMQASTVVLGDVDGDGAPDLALGSGARFESRLYLNDGRGAFRDVTAQRWPGARNSTAALLLADLDGDRDLDLIEGLFGPDLVHRNDGRGTFAVAWASLQFDLTQAMAVADVDGDGDPDLIVANGGLAVGTPVQDRLYLNQGGLAFLDVTAARLPADDTFTTDVAAGDLDGDGDADLLFADLALGGGEARPRLYRNDGRGTFRTASLAAGVPAVSVAMGDADGDGDLDVALGTIGQPRLLRNDGSLTFVDVTAGRLPVMNTYAVGIDFVDLDQDGDLDLLLADGGYSSTGSVNRTSFLVNEGLGSFTDATASALGTVRQVSEIAVGDVDLDGDLDLALACSGPQSRVLLGTARHQQAPWLARPGRPFALDVHAHGIAAPHEALVFLAGRELAVPLPLPPFGRLCVDPTSVFAAFALAVPAGAPGRLGFALPDDPALAGHAFSAQSLVWPIAPPALARLTNASREVVAPR